MGAKGSKKNRIWTIGTLLDVGSIFPATETDITRWVERDMADNIHGCMQNQRDGRILGEIN